jgi:CubicO group peptidase (beta-lactamase class C family)
MMVRTVLVASGLVGLAAACVAWQPQAAASGGLDKQALSAFEQSVAKGELPAVTSVLIVTKGNVAYERYWETGGAAVGNDTRSATKSLTAMAVGLAIADGKLRGLDDRAFAYLGDLAPFANDSEQKRDIRIGDLLTMTSALDCDDNNDTPGNEENMYPKQSWARFAVDLPLKKDWARDSSGRGPWAYCTAGTFLLGQIVQRATGQTVDRYIEDRVLKPVGAKALHWDASPSGEIQTGGGLELTTRDLGKLAWMMTDGGRWKRTQVLSAAWVAEMLTVRRDAFADMHYGYQYWHRVYPTKCGPVDAWFMAGNGGNHVLSIPSLKAAIVVTRTAYNTRGMHQQTIAALEKYLIPALPCAAR